MLFKVGVSCRISYSIVSFLYVSCRGLMPSVVEYGFFLLSFTCYNVVSVRRGFHFLLVSGIGCVIFIKFVEIK